MRTGGVGVSETAALRCVVDGESTRTARLGGWGCRPDKEGNPQPCSKKWLAATWQYLGANAKCCPAPDMYWFESLVVHSRTGDGLSCLSAISTSAVHTPTLRTVPDWTHETRDRLASCAACMSSEECTIGCYPLASLARGPVTMLTPTRTSMWMEGYQAEKSATRSLSLMQTV